MACSTAAILDEKSGYWMLEIEDRWFSSTVERRISIHIALGSNYTTYPRKGDKRYQII
jgi:hypothetical protein